MSQALTQATGSTALDDQLDQLARACRILELEGHGDMSLEIGRAHV
jgi:hypothetical protein